MSSADPAIDVHTHFVPHGWPALPGAEPAWLRIESERDAMIMVGSREFRRIQSDCWDPAVRVADMDADGIAQQVVSPTPVFFGYAHTAADATRISAIFNDLALEICAGRPDRLVPFCQVPLQDTDAACAELDRCLADGHAGVEIGNHVGDRDLDDEGIVTFLQHCAAVGAPVFVHPWDLPDLTAAATVDGAVAHRHARRDPPVDPGDGARRGVRPDRPIAADLLRPRRRVVPDVAGPDGQRLAPPTGRHRHLRVPAVALRRPVLGGFGRLRRGCAAVARRDDGSRPGDGRQRLPVPVRGTSGRRCGPLRAFLDDDDRTAILTGNAQRFLSGG